MAFYYKLTGVYSTPISSTNLVQNKGAIRRVMLSHRRMKKLARIRSGRSVRATDCRSSSRNTFFILRATPSS